MIKIPASFIKDNFPPADFLANCREVFLMYGQRIVEVWSREEAVDKLGRFTLRMPGRIGKLSGCKLIEELPSAESGKLGQRSAVIRIKRDDSDDEIELDAEDITNMRTGAAGVLGMEYMAPKARNIAILGTGKIATALALCAIEFGVEAMHVYSRKSENREKFKQDIIEHSAFDNVILHDSIPGCVLGVEVILTAVPTPEPILFLKDLPRPVYISVMGGDSRTLQLDPEILKEGLLIPDNLEQCQRSGEFKIALEKGYYGAINFARIGDKIADIGDAAMGRITPSNNIVLCYFTGLAIQDLAAAQMVYQKFKTIPT